MQLGRRAHCELVIVELQFLGFFVGPVRPPGEPNGRHHFTDQGKQGPDAFDAIIWNPDRGGHNENAGRLEFARQQQRERASHGHAYNNHLRGQPSQHVVAVFGIRQPIFPACSVHICHLSGMSKKADSEDSKSLLC